ncbi:MAG: sugar phosphate isomerase/epimerase family protein [Spirochaetota bacterium]
MKISCSTTLAHRAPLDTALKRIADLGFTDIDLLMAHGWAHVSPRSLVEDFAAESAAIRKTVNAHGLNIVALNVAFSGPLYGRSHDDVARRKDECLAIVNLMNAMDIPVAAVQPGGRPHGVSDNQLIADASASWAELVAIAAEKDRTLALELHTGSPFDSPDSARELVNHVPETRFAFDPSHLVGQGIDLHQVGWILERAAHVHLRDAESGRVQVAYGTGTVDFDWILGHLRHSGYDGYLAVEYLDTDEFDVTESARGLAEKIRSAISG